MMVDESNGETSNTKEKGDSRCQKKGVRYLDGCKRYERQIPLDFEIASGMDTGYFASRTASVVELHRDLIVTQ